MQTYTLEEVAKHATEESLWIVIDAKVYDITDFVDAHPGSNVVLTHRDVAGKDCTDQFYNLHRHEVLTRYSTLQIGTVQGQRATVKSPEAGDIRYIPYGEPTYLKPEIFASPYFTSGHIEFQKRLRKFLVEEVLPEAMEKEDSGELISKELMLRMGDVKLNHMRLGPGKHLHGALIFDYLKGEDFDVFHELIVHYEIGRLGTRAFQDGLLVGMVIGLPPLFLHAKDEIRDRVIDEVLSGRETLCLAMTEPFAGSDVAGIQTEAVLSDDGQYFEVSGVKQWITTSRISRYYSTAVKTKSGLMMLLIDTHFGGVTVQPTKTSYSSTAGTGRVTFDRVRVPVSHMLSEEGKGLKTILANTSHERWLMNCLTIGLARRVCEESLLWAKQRKVFGHHLIDEPVIRARLGRMFAAVESASAWNEAITYQMAKMDLAIKTEYLSGPIALSKYAITRMEFEVADEAVHIWGGRSLTQGGMGRLIETLQRTRAFSSILGGTESILSDLAVRRAIRHTPQDARLRGGHRYMGFTISEIFLISLLLVNAIAVLNEERFLSRIGWSSQHPGQYSQFSDPGYGVGQGQASGESVKVRLVNLISAIRTLLRIPLIAVNILVIAYELVLG
ncbi:hypothetical protein E5Q_06472 [Mixia osmundae IAM 14324]|uniref:Cytochrome b5 heme-binding domain-containing protein n=1 Tax=Mixia osmundae (strain CBS 9802 / IAM 14324 / JCM 22182 / KY 12970) TaxID=764103 RepID=G7EAA9_MIXOS|nr:hypothetical protein E5Q_06472 [Mixia osmundae IAM 14324]